MHSAIEETNRIVKLAEDLLLLARAHDGTLPLAPERSRSSSFSTSSASASHRSSPNQVASSSSIVLPGGGRLILADPDRIRQAVSNLIDNSLRYGDGPVTVSARRAGAIELHVSDRGHGFGEALAGRAFDRFSRADVARGRDGVGLGLAIVRTIAQAHGGDAEARDLPQGGADVWLAIPLANDAAACHAQLVGR